MKLTELTLTKIAELLVEKIGGGEGGYEKIDSLFKAYASETTSYETIMHQALNGREYEPTLEQLTESNLKILNEDEKIAAFLEGAVDLRRFESEEKQQEVIAALSELLDYDGYKLEVKGKKAVIIPTASGLVEISKLPVLSHEFVNQQKKECEEKIATGNYHGAITNARSLTEQIILEIIEKITGKEVGDYKGDLVKMSKSLFQFLAIEKENEQNIKQTSRGLISIINGFSALSNDLSDRHGAEGKRRVNVYPHYSKLAVNAAFTYCEFILEEFERKKNADPTPLGELAKLLPELTHEQHMAIFGFAKELQKAAQEEAKEQEALDAITYEARQKLQPMTWEELNERLKRAEENIASGNVFTEEEMDREMEKWEEEDDE